MLWNEEEQAWLPWCGSENEAAGNFQPAISPQTPQKIDGNYVSPQFLALKRSFLLN